MYIFYKYLIQHSLKSGGIKYHFKQVKVPGATRVHGIAYGFRGSSEKIVSPINFILQNTSLVSGLAKCVQILLVMSDRTDEFHELCTTPYWKACHKKYIYIYAENWTWISSLNWIIVALDVRQNFFWFKQLIQQCSLWQKAI